MAQSEVGIRLSVSGDAQVRGALGNVERSMGGLSSAAEEARKTMLSLTGSLAGAVSVKQFFDAADAVTTLNNQLKLATGSAQAAGKAYEALFDIAQRSRVSFTELGSTFASISRAGQELGISQQRLLTVTESIGNAMTISGGSAASMQAALVQLGQGIASGTLRGEELNSVMEQTPRLAKALADGLGVPIGKLREMGAAGQITSEQVISALEDQAAVLRGEVAGATLTVAQAFTQLQNASIKTVGEFDKATGASNALATAISGLSSTVSTVGQAFKDNETAITTTLGILGGAAVGTALARTATGLGSVATGVGGVAGAVAVLKGVVSSLNPATLMLLGLGTAVGGFVAYNAAQAKTADGIRRTIKELEDLNKTGPGIYNRDAAGIASYNKSVDERTAKIRELRGQLAQMDAQNLDTKAEDARLLRHVASAKSVAAEGAAYDDLRLRLSTFRGDYAKYQADLKLIQSGMASGAISQSEGIAMLTELAKKHGEVAKASKTSASEAKKAAEAELEWRRRNTLEMVKCWEDEAEARKKALADARAGALKISEAAESAQAASANQLAERLASMRDEIATIGLTTEQVAALTAQKEQQIIADKEIELIMLRNADASAVQIQELEREINLRRQLVGAIREKSTKEVVAESAKSATEEWKRAAEQIEQSLTDALMRGFESGKGFAENLRDTVVNMFKTMVLRPIIQATVQGGLNAIGLGGPAGSMGGNLLGSAVFGSSAAYGAALGTTSIVAGSQAAMLAAQTGEFGLAGLSATSGAAGGAMSSLVAAAPYAAAALAVASLIDSLDDSGTMHTGGLGSYSAAGGSAVGNAVKSQGLNFNLSSNDYQASSQQAAVGISQAVVGILDATAQTFGQKAGYYAATGFADDTSDDGAWGALMLKLGDKVLLDWKDGQDRWPGREFSSGEAGAKEYAAAVALDVRRLLIEQTPDWADTMLTALGDAPSLEQLAATVGQINAVASALDGMGLASQAFAGMADSAASALITALGGAESAVTGLSAYYQNFYSEAERSSIATGQLTEKLSALGVALPETTEAYRALIDGAIASGNQQLAADLIKLSGAYASVAQSAEDATRKMQAASDRISQEGLNLHEKWLQTIGDKELMREYELSKIDPINQWLQTQIWAYEDQQVAAEQAARATAEYTASLQEQQEFLASVARTVREWIDNRNSTSGTPTENVSSARAAFNAQMALARSGNRDAMSGITGYADRLVSAAEQGMGYVEAQSLIASVMQQMTNLPAGVSTDDLMLDELEKITTNTSNTATNTGQAKSLTFSATDPLRSIWEATKTGTMSTADLLKKAMDGTLGMYVSLSEKHNAKGALDIGTNLWKAASLWGGDAPRVRTSTAAAASAIPAASATFATGGVFTNSVVSSPTMFDMGLMGEAGPEAIMPLSRGPGGALGVQVYGSGQGGGDTAAQRDAQRELLAEVKRLGEHLDKTREELRQMRQENNIGNAKIADSTTRTARLHERWSVVGLPATEAAHA